MRRQMVRQLPVRKELLEVVKPGILMTQHSFSSALSFHPHWHIIVSDGVFTPEGDFIPLWNWDTQALLEDLRTSILRAFVRWSKLSPEMARNLQEWELERSGFSCFLSPVILEDDKEGLARLVRYLFRSPVSYRQLSYDEATGEFCISLLVWRVDPLECPKCGEQMVRGRTMRGEELREFLKSINRLGYPRPPPVPLAGRDWPQESLEDPFIESSWTNGRAW